MKQSDPEAGARGALEEWAHLAAALGLVPRPEAGRLLLTWARHILDWRSRAQLTAHRTCARIIGELMVPALYATSVAEFSAGARVVDVGCGSGATTVSLWAAGAAGSAGRWTMVDRATPKVVFCRHALRACGITGIDVGTPGGGVAGGDHNLVLSRGLPRTAQMAAELREYAGFGGVVVTWLPHATGAAEDIQCGDRHIWVSSGPGRFT